MQTTVLTFLRTVRQKRCHLLQCVCDSHSSDLDQNYCLKGKQRWTDIQIQQGKLSYPPAILRSTSVLILLLCSTVKCQSPLASQRRSCVISPGRPALMVNMWKQVVETVQLY